MLYGGILHRSWLHRDPAIHNISAYFSRGRPVHCFPYATIIEALNAGANYWKHCEEWFETLNKADNAKLKGNALKTLDTIEKATSWADYTCANLLSILVDEEELFLSPLLLGIAEWRKNLMNKY
jgi:hypothetical protein